MSGRRFGIFTVLLVLIILFCMKGTVMSKGNAQRAKENNYYRALEQEYAAAAREFLHEQGLDDCGVTMTRVTYESGSREYTVRIYHKRLQNMSREEKSALEIRLSQEEFEQGICTFRYVL